MEIERTFGQFTLAHSSLILNCIAEEHLCCKQGIRQHRIWLSANFCNRNLALAFHLIILYILWQIIKVFLFFYRTITATVSTITLNLKTITVLLTSLLAPPWPPPHFHCRFLITNSKIYWMGFSFHYYHHHHHHANNILLFSLFSPLQPIPPHFVCFTSPSLSFCFLPSPSRIFFCLPFSSLSIWLFLKVMRHST